MTRASIWQGLHAPPHARSYGASSPRQHSMSWETLQADGEVKLAVGASFLRSQLSQIGCHILERPPTQTAQWRQVLSSLARPQVVFLERAIWEDPEFVSNGLAQLCHHLQYEGHFVWTDPPSSWPQSAQSRARMLRLCSLHGLVLLGHVQIQASTQRAAKLQGAVLWRRCPIKTLENSG